MARTIIFGDVHGCIEELTTLWERLAPGPGDVVVSAGDLVHKGPDDGAVVRWCRTHGVVLTLGNHELQQARFRVAMSRVPLPPELQDAPRHQRLIYQAARVKVRDDAARRERLDTELALDEDDVAYLQGASLVVPVPGGVVIHGGVLPTTTHLPTAEELAGMNARGRQAAYRLARVRHVRGQARTRLSLSLVVPGAWTDDEAVRAMVAREAERLTVTERRVSPAGGFVVLGDEQPDDPYWADVYDGRFGHVYAGHDACLQDHPRVFPHATALDTGCVMGGWLTAAVLEDGEVSYVSERSRRAYTEEFRWP